MAGHGIFDSGVRVLDGWRARRPRWRMQRIMEGLPAGIRKDIGRPDALAGTDSRFDRIAATRSR